MTAGTYARTPEIRAKNRANAFVDGAPCADGCTCGKHRSQVGRPGRPCQPGCTCRRHRRSDYHNQLIGEGVKYRQELNRRDGKPINQNAPKGQR